ncbi:MAG: hypothetical protein ACTSXC_04845 [Candidatus Freyarchaeota archaeon]
MSEEKLTRMERAVLTALAEAVGYSLHAHVPKKYILNKLPKHLRPDASKVLGKLRANGYIQIHPTKGETTYQLTRKGYNMVMGFTSRDKGFGEL